MSLTLAGLIVSPVGCVFAGSMAQLPSRLPASVYLNTLSVLPSSTSQSALPSVTMSLGLVLPLAKENLLAAVWLPERREAAPVYLNTLSLLVLLATIQTSVPFVAMPSTVALFGRPPAAHDP